MSRKALLAALAGAMALGFGALSAQAAPVSMSEVGLHAGKAGLVQKAHSYWRYHHRHHRRHHRHHRWW
jgi:hypothetical protein